MGVLIKARAKEKGEIEFWIFTHNGERDKELGDLVEEMLSILQETKQDISRLIEIGNKEEIEAKKFQRAIEKGKKAPQDILLITDDRVILEGLKGLDVLSGSPLPVVVVEGSYKYDDLIGFINSSSFMVNGIIRLDRLLKRDYEECFSFVSVLKDFLRTWLRTRFSEEDLFKDIGWKFPVENKEVFSSYTSFFMDRKTRLLGRELKLIAGYLRRLAKEWNKMRKEWEDMLFSLEGKLQEKADEREILNEEIEFSKKYGGCVGEEGLPAVLLLGETGTGKRLLAEWIAKEIYSRVDPSRFVSLSLTGLGKEIAESELFGTLTGAYTDSRFMWGVFRKHRGKVIFLDEIGDMYLEHQAKLLTYLDRGYVRPIGWDAEDIFAPAIIIAATNKPLENMIRDGTFRKDLFYRFKYRLKLPSLRERKEDMSLLISLCLQNPSINPERKVKKISLEALSYLKNREYPGNFRELEAVIREGVRRAVMEGKEVLLLRHLIVE